MMSTDTDQFVHSNFLLKSLKNKSDYVHLSQIEYSTEYAFFSFISLLLQ